MALSRRLPRRSPGKLSPWLGGGGAGHCVTGAPLRLSGTRGRRVPPRRDLGEPRPAARRQLFCASPAVTRPRALFWCGPDRRGAARAAGEAVARLGRGPDNRFAAGSLVSRIPARRPGLARYAGSRSLPGMFRVKTRVGGSFAGEEVSRGPVSYYYYYFPSQPTKAAGPARGRGWLRDGGFPEQTLQVVYVSTRAFCSLRVSSGL